MAKRGRPAGADSEQTKEKIINAARHQILFPTVMTEDA